MYYILCYIVHASFVVFPAISSLSVYILLVCWLRCSATLGELVPFACCALFSLVTDFSVCSFHHPPIWISLFYNTRISSYLVGSEHTHTHTHKTHSHTHTHIYIFYYNFIIIIIIIIIIVVILLFFPKNIFFPTFCAICHFLRWVTYVALNEYTCHMKKWR